METFRRNKNFLNDNKKVVNFVSFKIRVFFYFVDHVHLKVLFKIFRLSNPFFK